MALLKFNQEGKTREWAASSGTADVMYFCADGTIVLNGQVCGSYSVTASGVNGKINVNGTDITVYTHPAAPSEAGTGGTAAAAVKVGKDATGHVVLGGALAKGDVGLGNVDNKSAATLKSEFAGSIADGNTGFVTGDAIYDALGLKIDSSEKGVANGVATLDSSGKVPASELPSYVDDIIEGYYYNGAFYSDASHTQFITGEAGKIYVDITPNASPANRTYRYSGSAYIEIVASPGTLDDIAEGTTNKHFTATEKTKLSNISAGANKTEESESNGFIKIDGMETQVYEHPAAPASAGTGGTAPSAKKVGMDASGHVVLGDALAKGDVGLSNVTNDAQIKAVTNSTEGHLLAFGIDGSTVEDAGFGEDVLEKNTNKVTTVRDASNASDTSYPSEKAVRTAINSKKTAYTDLESNLQGKIDTYEGHVNDAGSDTITPVSRGLYKIGVTEQGHVRTDTGNTPTAVVKSDLTGLGVEDASNKVTSLSASSTDTQYPSAKCMYDLIKALQDRVADLEDALTLEKASE